MEERICSRSHWKANVITWSSDSNLFLGFIANLYIGGENLSIHSPLMPYQQIGRHGGCVTEGGRKRFREECVYQLLSRVQLSVTPRTVTCQAPLSTRFSRQEYWSGSLYPPPGTAAQQESIQSSRCPRSFPLYTQGGFQSLLFLDSNLLESFPSSFSPCHSPDGYKFSVAFFPHPPIIQIFRQMWETREGYKVSISYFQCHLHQKKVAKTTQFQIPQPKLEPSVKDIHIWSLEGMVLIYQIG